MSSPNAGSPPLGRRERNVNEKQQRIFAAAEIFDELGFANVTTQQIADRADVAVGTIFRYAASKSELLLMVYNEHYRQALDSGRTACFTATGVHNRLRALLTPLVETGRRNDENTSHYQQAVLYGRADERYRSEARMLAEGVQVVISEILIEAVSAPELTLNDSSRTVEPAAATAARAIFAVLQLETAQALTAAVPVEQQLADTMNQAALIVRGYLHDAPEQNSPGAPRGGCQPSRMK